MNTIINVLSVFGLGAVELWWAIPAGHALRLHPVTVGIASGTGAIAGAAIVLLVGERARSWLLQRRKQKESGEKDRGTLWHIWLRYGVRGLGLLAPVLTGAPLGIAAGLLFGAPPGRLMFWVSVGTLLWTPLLTLAAYYGCSEIMPLFGFV